MEDAQCWKTARERLEWEDTFRESDSGEDWAEKSGQDCRPLAEEEGVILQPLFSELSILIWFIYSSQQP